MLSWVDAMSPAVHKVRWASELFVMSDREGTHLQIPLLSMRGRQKHQSHTGEVWTHLWGVGCEDSETQKSRDRKTNRERHTESSGWENLEGTNSILISYTDFTSVKNIKPKYLKKKKIRKKKVSLTPSISKIIYSITNISSFLLIKDNVNVNCYVFLRCLFMHEHECMFILIYKCLPLW